MSKKETLRTWRRFRNLTQKELAEKIGTSNVTISSYEKNGLNQARVETLIKIIEALEIDFDQLEVN